ncbi:hypothetical protein HDU67_008406 [Dinochytrium kinnereticum]|nr:hypothetical protein HDU67_008406 [Dinochytrium kinnereticum]
MRKGSSTGLLGSSDPSAATNNSGVKRKASSLLLGAFAAVTLLATIAVVGNSWTAAIQTEVQEAQLTPPPQDDPSSHQSAPINLSSSAKEEHVISKRYFRARGFEFCKGMENATFDALAVVGEWGSISIAERNPTMKEFARFVDGHAKRIFKKMLGEHSDVLRQDLKSLSCYAAADGANAMADISNTRMLNVVSAANYMRSRVPHVDPVRHLKSRPSYKVAYLILAAGGKEVIENIEYQINKLDDGSAIFLIHVETTSKPLINAIRKRVKPNRVISERRGMTSLQHQNASGKMFSDHVYLMEKQYRAISDHASMVWMQLNGYFQLLDLANWDVVINLMPQDVPVKSASDIAAVFARSENKGKLFIQHYYPEVHTASRMLLQNVLSSGRQNVYYDEAVLLFPPFHSWRFCEHSPWMILTRDFIEYLRISDKAATYLAYAEHHLQPSSLFFCAAFPKMALINTPSFPKVALSDPTFLGRISNDNKRLHNLNKEVTFQVNNLEIRNGLETEWIPDVEMWIEDEQDPPPFRKAWKGKEALESIHERHKEYLFAGKVDVRTKEGKRVVALIEGHQNRDGFMRLVEGSMA